MTAKQEKTEAELILTVLNLKDTGACLLFAKRARAVGMLSLVAACEERAKALKPVRVSGVKFTVAPRTGLPSSPKKTNIVAEQALKIMIAEYDAGRPPTTYGELKRRCGFEGQQNAKWFGQVTDLIDAACALAGVPSFALVRVRNVNGKVNDAAWRRIKYSHLRDRIIASALAGKWSEEDFTKMRAALAVFSGSGFGHKKAWSYVWTQISMEAWAGVPVTVRIENFKEVSDHGAAAARR